MNYYIIPKIITNIDDININSIFLNRIPKQIITKSLYYFFNIINNQLKLIKEDNKINENIIDDTLEPYKIIKNIILNYNYKLNYNTIDYFILIEIVNIFNIIDNNIKNVGIYGDFNKMDICEILNNEININIVDNKINGIKYDIIFLSKEQNMDIKIIIYNFINIILKYQKLYGICIIRLDNLFYDICIDFIYILSIVYDKVFLYKPIVSHYLTNERYIICKGYNSNININNNISNKIDIPIFFMNKLEEINIIIGQPQLDYIYQVITIIKNKKLDKLEIIKKNNNQKYLKWIERYIFMFYTPIYGFIDK